MGTTEELVTVQEAAHICGLHEATVRRRIASGELPVEREGGATRVRRRDLAAVFGDVQERKRRSRAFAADDPLWRLAGAFEDPGGSWVSSDIHRAIAEAIPPRE